MSKMPPLYAIVSYMYVYIYTRVANMCIQKYIAMATAILVCMHGCNYIRTCMQMVHLLQ